MKKIAVLLHGNGVYDGTEIQEAVLTLLSIAENNGESICFAPNINHHHIIDHTTGNEMDETRNVLVESARIVRGKILDIANLNVEEMDALVMPGGFGTAKNITKWAFEGAEGKINTEVEKLIKYFVDNKKPIVGLCMSSTTIAKALDKKIYSAKLTVGTTKAKSPYEIDEITKGIVSLGHTSEMKSVSEITYDKDNKIITAPCYMMDANILQVRNNIKLAIEKLFSII